MDLTNLLSILNSNGNNNTNDLLNLFSMFNNSKTTASENKQNQSNLNEKGNLDNNSFDQNNLFASLLSGNKPDISSLLNMYNKPKQNAYGIKPITPFASDEILGVLSKFFINH